MTISISMAILALLLALGVGGVAGGAAGTRMSRAEVAEAEADAEASRATVGAVEAAVAQGLAEAQTTAGVTSEARARLVCEGDLADPAACMAYLLCAQVAGGTVQPTACDAVVNQWVSERQITLVEAGGADAPRRDERRRTLERRK